MNFLIIWGIICGLAIVGLVIWLIRLYYSQEEEPTDYTMVDNFMPQYSEGYSSGIVVEIIKGRMRTGIKFLPRDIDYVKYQSEKKKFEIEAPLIWVERDKLIPLMRGSWSSERHRMWILPPEPEDLPEDLKQTPFGKALIEHINHINSAHTEVQMIREGSERVKDIINRVGDGEATRAELGRIEDLYDEGIKTILKTRDSKGSMGSSTYGSANPSGV